MQKNLLNLKKKRLMLFPYFSLFPLIFSLFPLISYGQEKYTVSGYVKDSASGESMIGANVYIKELLQGSSTNQYGFYSITVAKGNYHLVISFLGFTDIVKEIDLTNNIHLNISLEEKVITTGEVVIEAEKQDKNVESAQMGTVKIEVEQIKTLPAMLGEVDILKTIQMLPGVLAAGEGNSGFYVRGGGPDQNLILLDEAVVYNVSHLFGFFSIFNSDAINNIELIKGGMPANYGGRLASVLDISMKEGNMKKWAVEGGIGAISSRLTVQGPIKKDVSSFIVSGRRTYADIYMPLIINNNEKMLSFKGTSYFFYDLTTKVNYKISDKDRIFASGYFGRDVFNYNQSNNSFKVKIPWGNATGSLRWNHLFNDKLFLNTSLIFSDYKFSFEVKQYDFNMIFFSGIRDYNAKADLSYYPSIRHNIKFGANYIYHTFTPSSASASQGDVVFDTGKIIRQYADDAAIYINDEFDWTDRLKVNAGLRYGVFMHVGPFTRFTKDPLGSTSDTLVYKTNEPVKTYQGLEPRLSVRYQLNMKSSVKAAYTINNQYIHLATLSGVSLPTDVWVASSDVVKPQKGVQYAAGYFRNFLSNQYESSVELYYKTMKNMIEYQEGYLPGDNILTNSDNGFTFGEGESYGAEFFIKKRTGKLTGWIGYTLSKTNRKFASLNNGTTFPAKYDRRHDLALVANYDLDKKPGRKIPDSVSRVKRTFGNMGNWFRSRNWVLSSNFVYATGDAFTPPAGRYFFEGNIVIYYGERNSYRMAPYHRLDIGVTLKGKENKRYKSNWNLSVYNVYSRANPYFIYFANEGDINKGTLKVKAVQVSLFPILPTITWNFNF